MTPPQSPEAIELARLHEAATPGPWRKTGRCGVEAEGRRSIAITTPNPKADDGSMDANAALIAALRNIVPRIIAGLDLLANQEAMVN